MIVHTQSLSASLLEHLASQGGVTSPLHARHLLHTMRSCRLLLLTKRAAYCQLTLVRCVTQTISDLSRAFAARYERAWHMLSCLASHPVLSQLLPPRPLQAVLRLVL